MTAYAQTNIQLYGQLIQANWSDADLQLVQSAYELAMRVFAGHFRPNRKPFLSHLVGVASIVAAHGGESTAVTAGLLHSAYSHGEFGDGSRGTTSTKREKVSRAIGPAAESLVARYSESRWKTANLVDLLGKVEQVTAPGRAVALIKLADVLEDHLERGMQFSPHKETSGSADAGDEWRDAMERLADALGFDRLAVELRAALAPSNERPLPSFLLGDKSASFMLAPISHRVRTSVRLGRLFRRWRRKFASVGQWSARRAA